MPVEDDQAEAWRVVVVWTGGADAGDVGRWKPLELVDDGSGGTLVGSFPLAQLASERLTYGLQAVDSRSNVSWRDWESAETPASGKDLEVPLPVELTLENTGRADTEDVRGLVAATGGAMVAGTTIGGVAGADILIGESDLYVLALRVTAA